jgi:hypothetical protein
MQRLRSFEWENDCEWRPENTEFVACYNVISQCMEGLKSFKNKRSFGTTIEPMNTQCGAIMVIKPTYSAVWLFTDCSEFTATQTCCGRDYKWFQYVACYLGVMQWTVHQFDPTNLCAATYPTFRTPWVSDASSSNKVFCQKQQRTNVTKSVVQCLSWAADIYSADQVLRCFT